MEKIHSESQSTTVNWNLAECAKIRFGGVKDKNGRPLSLDIFQDGDDLPGSVRIRNLDPDEKQDKIVDAHIELEAEEPLPDGVVEAFIDEFEKTDDVDEDEDDDNNNLDPREVLIARESAMMLCQSCLIVKDCLDRALRLQRQNGFRGIAGATTSRERNDMLKKLANSSIEVADQAD